MSITPTDRGVFQTATSGAITLSATSATFSPAAGSLLAVLVSTQSRNDSGSSTDITFVLSDNIGDTGGGSWTRTPRCARVPGGNGVYMESVEIWTRVIGTSPGTSKTVTVTGSYNSGANTTSTDGWVFANVVEISGQHATPIGASTGATARQAAGPTSITLTLGGAPASTSVILSVIQQDNATSGATVPSGWSLLNDASSVGLNSESATAVKNGSGSTSFSWTGLSTGSNELACALEIVAAASAAVATPAPVRSVAAVHRASRW